MPPPDSHASETRAPSVIAVVAVMMCMSTICTIARLWARLAIPKLKLWWDDWFAFLAFLFILANLSIPLRDVSLGFGRHEDTLPIRNLVIMGLHLYIGVFVYNFALALPKYAVIFMYARVFWTQDHRAHKVAIWIAGASNSIVLITSIFGNIWVCHPIRKAWWGTLISGSCSDQYDDYRAYAIAGLILDTYILILPHPMLWGLKIKLRRKLYVVGMFLCGYLVIAVTVGRLISLVKLGREIKVDTTWTQVDYFLWNFCEGPICLLGVSLPCMNNLLKQGREHGWLSLFTSRKHTAISLGNGSKPSQDSYARMEKDRNRREKIDSANGTYIEQPSPVVFTCKLNDHWDAEMGLDIPARENG